MVFAAVRPANLRPIFAPILPNIANTTKSPHKSFSTGRQQIIKHDDGHRNNTDNENYSGI